ncbi:hypothetical protein BDR04DRAFT_1118590 [Suillus decipiens]|nr:hypothetical protein BDR04DRAFT_1118590 [Suillus decipiens]
MWRFTLWWCMMNQSQSSGHISDSDTSDADSEDDEDLHPRTSRVNIPPGFPPTSPEDPPLHYYNEPAVSAFNFSHAAQDYLLHIGTLPCMLCKIDSTLGHSISEWLAGFQAAGLTHEQACALWAQILSGSVSIYNRALDYQNIKKGNMNQGTAPLG